MCFLVLIFHSQKCVCQFQIAACILPIHGFIAPHKLGNRVHVPAKKFAIYPQAVSILWNLLPYGVWPHPLGHGTFGACGHSFRMHLCPKRFRCLNQQLGLAAFLTILNYLITSVPCSQGPVRSTLLGPAEAPDMEHPQLMITEKSASDLRGACSSCGRSFHAFVRGTEEDAMWLITRGFKLHCRKIHSLVIHPALGVEEMVEGLPLPAYVCTKGTRKLLAANGPFRQMMGYTAEEMTDLRLDDLRAPEDIPPLIESLQRPGGGTVEQRCRTKGGHLLRVRLRYQDINLFQNETALPDTRFVVLTNVQTAQGASHPAMISFDKGARVGKSAERRHPRFKVESNIQVLCGAAVIQGQVLDLSESGIAVNIPGEVKAGERVILRFLLPNSEHQFGVQATVKYSNGSRHGLEFHKLARRESDELWRVCRALSATAYYHHD